MSQIHEVLQYVTDRENLTIAGSVLAAGFIAVGAAAFASHRSYNRNHESPLLLAEPAPLPRPETLLPPRRSGSVYQNGEVVIAGDKEGPVRAVAKVAPAATRVMGTYPVPSMALIVGHII